MYLKFLLPLFVYLFSLMVIAEEDMRDGLVRFNRMGRDQGMSYSEKVLLKKGTHLLDLSDNKVIILPRDMYAMSQRKQFINDSVYILDSNGEPKFETTIANVIPVEADFRITADPEFFETYTPHENIMKDDDYFSFENTITAGIQYADTTYFYDTFSGVKKASYINHVSYRMLYLMTNRFSFGINTDYLSANLVDGNDEYAGYSNSYKWRALNLGPEVRYRWGSAWKIDFLSSLIVKQSLFFELGDEYKFSSSMWHLTFETQYKSNKGRFILGMDLGRYTIAVTDYPVTYTPPQGSGKVTSLGLYGGYSFNLNL